MHQSVSVFGEADSGNQAIVDLTAEIFGNIWMWISFEDFTNFGFFENLIAYPRCSGIVIDPIEREKMWTLDIAVGW